MYGIDWDGPVPTDVEGDQEEIVPVPRIPCPLSDADFNILEQTFTTNMILGSQWHAVDVYANVVESHTMP